MAPVGEEAVCPPSGGVLEGATRSGEAGASQETRREAVCPPLPSPQGLEEVLLPASSCFCTGEGLGFAYLIPGEQEGPKGGQRFLHLPLLCLPGSETRCSPSGSPDRPHSLPVAFFLPLLLQPGLSTALTPRSS